MGEYFVAKSYENYERIGEPFFKNNKLYTRAKCKCDRCVHGIYAVGVHNGEIVPHPAHNGVCLKCNGTGFIEKEIRLYTASEKARMERQSERNRVKREESAAAALKAKEEKSEENKLIWFSKNGFNSDGITYCITGDTYSIKDKLKELGCKFCRELGWHSPTQLPDYPSVSIDCRSVANWDCISCTMIFIAEAKTIVENAILATREPSKSNYLDAEVGQRLRDIKVTLKSQRGLETYFGWATLFTFAAGEDEITWFTSADCELENGKEYLLTGTVKKFDTYKGVKSTVLSRCIVKEVE